MASGCRRPADEPPLRCGGEVAQNDLKIGRCVVLIPSGHWNYAPSILRENLLQRYTRVQQVRLAGRASHHAAAGQHDPQLLRRGLHEAGVEIGDGTGAAPGERLGELLPCARDGTDLRHRAPAR